MGRIAGLGRWACCLLACATVSAGAARADALQDVFRQLIANPNSPELNLRYAALAEDRGELRKAFAAYERILASQPDHAEAKRGLRRVRRIMLPKITAVTLSGGIRYETNPRQFSSREARDFASRLRRREDVTWEARADLYDDRRWRNRRWRTLGSASADIHHTVSDLNAARVALHTGPIFDVFRDVRLHVAPGGAVQTLDDELLYGEASARFTFETVKGGATQSLSVLVGYRDVDSAFSASDGILVDMTGSFVKLGAVAKRDTFVFSPRLRWSSPTGSDAQRLFSSPLFPGDFFEAGGRAAYFFPTRSPLITLGVGLGKYFRFYDQNVVFETSKRRDLFLEPAAYMILNTPFGHGVDVRFDYRYQHNDSNDDFEDFTNHLVGVRLVKRF